MIVEYYRNKGASNIMSIEMSAFTFINYILKRIKDPSFGLGWEIVSNLFFELMQK